MPSRRVASLPRARRVASRRVASRRVASPMPDDAPSADRIHRVLDDDALVGTRAVRAMRENCGIVAVFTRDPCGACAPVRSAESDWTTDEAELRAVNASPERPGTTATMTTTTTQEATASAKDWTEAYEEFRQESREARERRQREACVSQLDEVNARLIEGLDAYDRSVGKG